MIGSQKERHQAAILMVMTCLIYFACTPAVFGRVEGYYVGDRVWFDENCNGLQDEGEGGILGVEVRAYDAATNEQLGQPDVTDENGVYRIQVGSGHDKPDPFYLRILLPEGMECQFTRTKVGDNNNAIDSDVDLLGFTRRLTWGRKSEAEVIDIDAGLCCSNRPDGTGRIGDYVWFDANRNGLQEKDEYGLNGVEITLEKPDGDTEVQTTGTGGPLNRPGFYLFENLMAGSHVVTVNPATVPAGYLPTPIQVAGSASENDSDDHAGTLVLLPDHHSSNLTTDFGYNSPCAGQIGDYVWLDEDFDGIQDPGERGINGVLVMLEDPFGNITTQTTFTGGALEQPGYYLFDGLCGGEYMVTVIPDTVPNGHVTTLINAPTVSPSTDSNHPVGTVVFLPENHSSDPTIDFGYVSPCQGFMGDYVWLDANGNGIQDGDEEGINDVTLVVADESGALRVQKTFTGGPLNRPGYFLFEGLCMGTYIVLVDHQTLPPGHEPTIINTPNSHSDNDSDDPDGTLVTLPENASGDDSVDFGYLNANPMLPSGP